MKFSFVDVTSPGSAGTINLLYDEYPLVWINNVTIAQQIKEEFKKIQFDRWGGGVVFVGADNKRLAAKQGFAQPPLGGKSEVFA